MNAPDHERERIVKMVREARNHWVHGVAKHMQGNEFRDVGELFKQINGLNHEEALFVRKILLDGNECYKNYKLHEIVASHFKTTGSQQSSEFDLDIAVSVRKPEPVPPPRKAELVLRFLLPKDARESLLGDLEEEFRTIMVPKYGLRTAKVWYWKQVAASVWPVFRSVLGKWIAVAWFGKLAAWLTSKLGS